MLSRMSLYFNLGGNTKVTYQKSSVFQGVLMERINPFYAEKLHESQFHPYSIKLLNEGKQLVWQVNTLNEEANEQIVNALMSDDFTTVKLRKGNLVLPVAKKDLEMTDRQALMEQYYFSECSRNIKICFQTPTAFKSCGQYVFFPDIRLIYQNLMQKYDSSSDSYSVWDEEVLEQLVEKTQIKQYRLKSVSFYMEGIRIPAFVGEITIHIHGTEQLVNLVNMILRFGEFSGVGIKTAIGMGGMKVAD